MEDIAEVQAYLDNMTEPLFTYAIYGALNEKEKVLEKLEELAEIPREITQFPFFSDMHFYDCVRSEPRFIELVEKARTRKIVN